MRARGNQGRFFAAAVLAWAIVAACAAPAPAGDEEVRAALTLRCGEALRSAVRTPSGWGWTVADAEAAPEYGDEGKEGRKAAPRRQRAPDPLIDAVPTAAVGVQLLWAGELLNDDRYRQAAREAARGLAAIQNPTGQVRARGLLGRAGGPKEPLAEVPDRAATRAALGLWLALLESEAQGAARARDSRRPPAAAAAHWLARQQTPGGAWPVLYPPDAPRGKGTRLVRLDDADCRDTALALLLAGDVLNDAHLRTVFDRGVEALLACRVASGQVPQPAVWQAAYSLDGTPQQKFADLPQGTDLLATRRAMEVLLCGHLLASNPNAAPALREAAAALAALPRKGDAWSRHYDRRGRPLDAAAKPANRATGFFQEPAAAEAQAPLALAPVLAAAGQIRENGEDALRNSLDAGLKLRQRVVAVLCGASGQLLGEGELGHASLQSQRVRALWLAVQKAAAAGKS
jgi:hypothetical protein